MKMHKLALSMIVKNEAPNIQRCLESVAPFINYYVICDTGSTDNTKEIIKSFFDSKGIPGEILDHEWKDFGHNRSLAIEACEGKAQWALMIDADDMISGTLPVEKFNDELDGYVVKIQRGEFVWYRAQLFNIGKTKWWYEEPLHEYAICRQPMNVQKLEGDYAWDVRTEGCRSRQFGNDIEKYKNDYEILKKYLAEDPKQPRKQFYAAQSAFDSRMFDIAEQEYIKRTELESWAEEVYFSWLRVGMCRTILEKPIEMITDAMMRAYETKPDRAESLYHLSCIYRKYGRPRNAFLVASMGLTIPPPQNDILFVDMANYRWGLLDEVATTAFYVGKYHMGLAACEKLLSEPYLPEEHRPRVENNKNAYINAIAQIQGQINAQQAQTLANMQTVKIPEPKTTLKISPENLAVKL
jgi:glycosyltransferase involved in cell wall biosynthesis